MGPQGIGGPGRLPRPPALRAGPDHIAPNGKGIVPEMLRLFQVFPFDKGRVPPTLTEAEATQFSQCQRLLRHDADETELELRLHWLGDVVVEMKKERDVIFVV